MDSTGFISAWATRLWTGAQRTEATGVTIDELAEGIRESPDLRGTGYPAKTPGPYETMRMDAAVRLAREKMLRRATFGPGTPLLHLVQMAWLFGGLIVVFIASNYLIDRYFKSAPFIFFIVLSVSFVFGLFGFFLFYVLRVITGTVAEAKRGRSAELLMASFPDLLEERGHRDEADALRRHCRRQKYEARIRVAERQLRVAERQRHWAWRLFHHVRDWLKATRAGAARLGARKKGNSRAAAAAPVTRPARTEPRSPVPCKPQQVRTRREMRTRSESGSP